MSKLNSLFLLVALGVATISAGPLAQCFAARQVGFLKTRSASLEAALHQWNDANERSDDLRYRYNTMDLNGDVKRDAIVFVSGDAVCGTGGCRVLIFKGNGKSYALLTDMASANAPVYVGPTKTKGWRDLAMEVAGKGSASHFATLKFDGRSYPENPTLQPALSKTKRAKFIEYLEGNDDYENDLPLK